MRVLIACEFSGRVRDAFAKLGHEAWSCDLLPSETEGNHYQGDIRDMLQKNWDLMIAHPPCTRLANSGVSWLNRRNLWEDMVNGARFFRMLLEANIPKIAVENPIPHKYAIEIIGRTYDQLIQPWMFGHGETKATCLWLKNLPPLNPTNIVEGREQRNFYTPNNKDRPKERSRTYQGIADAMAEQWGSAA